MNSYRSVKLTRVSERGPRLLHIIIKLCCYVIRSNRSPSVSPRTPGWPQVIAYFTRYEYLSIHKVNPCEWTGSQAVAYNDKTVLLRDTVHQISLGESAAAGADRSAPAADSPREIWWTVSRNYTVLFLSRDAKNIKKNWRWRRHAVALWRHDRGAWHNCLLLATASNINCWADIANHVTWLWQAGDTKNFERQITG